MTEPAAAAKTLVYCSQCEALVPMPEDRLLRASQDHELDAHRDAYGQTVYTKLGSSRITR